ncbi:long-chain-fatty-acid--CoA ligase [Salinibacterium sp. SYSU T00001]|uniref:long-chain-fatty-acid--CoA ligase n=1 Tax=Homoserinimonas sedimenticola TaxID=2986805 RepID=UPI002235B621|nr:long-chain-fatty-acid--CoA ligase [Salinibacterium sedimenticola]MCW4384754.1 long-chain-fatty-acid--CoA ligase [Salinibacterium sedimenticola]
MNQQLPPDTSSRPWLESYAPDVPHDIEVPAGSLLDIVEGSVREFPNAIALEFFGAETSYSQLGEQIERAAEGLRALGVKAGDPVALVLPNCPQHIAAFYAVLRLGAIVVEHNPLYTARELRHQFEDHNAKVVIAWDKVVEHIQAFPSDLRVDAIVSVDVTRAMPPLMRAALRLPIPRLRETRASLTTPVSGTVPWHELLASPRLSPDVAGPSAGDVAVIQYTSGTTGRPKGATLSHGNLGTNAAQARAWVPTIQRGDGCVVYAVLPMFHAYGLTLCLTFAMSMGARLVLFPKFDPDLVLKVARKHPPTFLPAVPPIYERLLAAAEVKGVSLSGVQIAISGAMPLTTALVEPWERATGGYLVEGYGLSECSPVLMANPVSEARRAGTVGLPLPGTEARVVDPEDPAVERALGEAGELLVRGPQIMRGYWKKPEETAEVFVADPTGGDPWFRTGDIVTIDAAGFVTIVDRIKELIITGGFNVSPSEVEESLKTHPDVVDAAVVGLPSERNGEDVTAAVVLRAGAGAQPEAIRDHVRPLLTPYKVPRRVVIVDELPKSLIGKTLRRVVRDNLLE